MNHHASAGFWQAYRQLPEPVRVRAKKQFQLLKIDPRHPSLQFKKIGERLGQEVWSVRVTLRYRALALRRSAGFLWFWIGDHATYDLLLQGK